MDPAAALQSARANYFDAWVAAQTGGESAAASKDTRLAAAKAAYNTARARLGLPPIQ